MVSRQSVIVELSADVSLEGGTSRAERIAKLRHAAADAKQRFLREVENLRPVDPEMEVLSRDTIFPLLVVTASTELIEALGMLPGVLRVSPAPDLELTKAR